MPANKKTPKEAMEEAFATATRALASDMPVLMHGSGGGEGNWETQKLVATLTVQYCQRLVEAAIDARDMLLSDNHRDLLPPPPLPRSRKPALPSNTKRKRASEEFWDDPLPEPKIRGQGSAVPKDETETEDKWVGVAGVDLWEKSRARAAYVSGISSQQFMFPVCHDTYVYGRIREVQAAKLTVTEPLLHDVTVIDMLRTEGHLQHQEDLQKRLRLRKSNNTKIKHDKVDNNKDSGSISDPEEEDVADESEADEEEEGPTWPGLQDLLPAHRKS